MRRDVTEIERECITCGHERSDIGVHLYERQRRRTIDVSRRLDVLRNDMREHEHIALRIPANLIPRSRGICVCLHAVVSETEKEKAR